MSWQRMRVFKCNLCGCEKGAYYSEELPPGWHGSGRKHGDCYCGKCHYKLVDKPMPPKASDYAEKCRQASESWRNMTDEERRALMMGVDNG